MIEYKVYTKLKVYPVATFHIFSHAKRYINAQQRVWPNAKFRTEWIDEKGLHVLEEKPSPKFISVGIADFRPSKDGFTVKLDPKKIAHPQDDALFCPSCHNLTGDGVFNSDDWCEKYKAWRIKYHLDTVETPDHFQYDAELNKKLKEKQVASLFGIPIKLTTSLSWWEKLTWWLTPTERFISADFGKGDDKTVTTIVEYKKQRGKIYIVNIK
jgi:hypothetical protein